MHDRALAVVLLVVLAAAPACTNAQRSDAWLLRHLREHRGEFDRLVRMADEDYRTAKVIRVAPTFTRLEDNWDWPRPESQWGISKARWDDYRALFRQLELPAGFDHPGPDRRQVTLMVYGTGLAGEGREYGYLWSPQPPEQVNHPNQEEFFTRPFEGPWYRYEWVIY